MSGLSKKRFGTAAVGVADASCGWTCDCIGTFFAGGGPEWGLVNFFGSVAGVRRALTSLFVMWNVAWKLRRPFTSNKGRYVG